MGDNNPTIDVPPEPGDEANESQVEGGLETTNLSPQADETADFELSLGAASHGTIPLPSIDQADQTQSFAGNAAAVTTKRTIRIPGYEILDELGRGAMGVVYKARQIRADRTVALKVMLNIDHARPQELQRFEVEAQSAARLQHPGIVQVYDVGSVGDLPYFTQEFVEGGTLAQRLAKETLQPAVAAQMLLQLVEAVAFAHSRGVIHRDLKPANVLVTSNQTLKIADFGLARRMEDQSHLTKDGTILGTPSYMAPEQAYGSSHEIGPLSDVYTLGAILYEFLVGRPPFKGATAWEVIEQVRLAEPVRPSEIERQVPKDLETICLKCLQKDPDRRYGSAGDLAADVRRYLNNEPILARPIGHMERLVRLCRRHPAEARLVGLVAALLLTLTVGAIWTATRISADRGRISGQRDQIEKQLKDLELKQQIADQRLTSRRETIFQVVNRLPQSLASVPFNQAPLHEISKLSEELLTAEADDERTDKEIGPSRQWGLMAVHMRRGEQFKDESQLVFAPEKTKLLQRALVEFQTAQKIAQRVVDNKQGDHGKALGNLATAIQGLALVQALLALPESHSNFEQVIQLRQKALEYEQSEESLTLRQIRLANALVDSTHASWKTAKVNIELARQNFEKVEEAVGIYELALANIEELNRAKTIHECHAAHKYAAHFASILGNQEAAIQHYRSAITLLQKLLKESPNAIRYQKPLTTIYEDLGDYLLKIERPNEARAEYVNLLLVMHALQSDAAMRELSDKWAMAYYRLGLAAVAENNEARRKKYFSRVVDIVQVPLTQREEIEGKVNPDGLWPARSFLMLAQAWAGQVEPAAMQARRIVERFREEKSDEALALLANAAFALAIAAQAVDQDHQAAAQAEALATLKLAIDAGYANLDYLLTDFDVAPLRAIKGFEELIQPLRQ